MSSSTLPDGFTWGTWIDGPGLFHGERLVAYACEVAVGWRLCLMGGGKPLRYEFLTDEAACRRYAEAWARKWQAEIRRHGTRPNGVP